MSDQEEVQQEDIDNNKNSDSSDHESEQQTKDDVVSDESCNMYGNIIWLVSLIATLYFCYSSFFVNHFHKHFGVLEH